MRPSTIRSARSAFPSAPAAASASGPSRPRGWGHGVRLLGLCLLASALQFGSGSALAQSDLRTEGDRAGATGLYDAEVPVNSQAEAERTGGFARALGTVLSKVTGNRAAAGMPGVGQELRKAKDYVDGYDYRQDQGTSAAGAPTFRTTLVVRFRQEQVDSLASVLGLPVWPQPRPKPVVWLGIDDGSGPRLVSVAQSNASRPLLDRAIARGFRLGLPIGSAAEQATVGAIWRQDTAAIALASARYSPPMQLVGKLYRAGGGWTADWVMVDGGRELAKWSNSSPDARQAMASGADGAADALSRKYAKRVAAGAAGTYRVVFTGVSSADAYLRLSGYLQGMVVVRRITPVSATGDTLTLDLELISGLPGFNRMLGDGAPVAPGSEDGLQPPTYRMK